MKIPKKVKIINSEIEVVWNDKLHYKEDAVGFASYREDKIEIQPNSKDWPRGDSDILHTFFHELTHWILHKMGENELRSNEKFIDTFSACLHQALVSGEIITDVVENNDKE